MGKTSSIWPTLLKAAPLRTFKTEKSNLGGVKGSGKQDEADNEEVQELINRRIEAGFEEHELQKQLII